MLVLKIASGFPGSNPSKARMANKIFQIFQSIFCFREFWQDMGVVGLDTVLKTLCPTHRNIRRVPPSWARRPNPEEPKNDETTQNTKNL